MIKANMNIRNFFREQNIPLWQIAYKMGVTESTLIRWLRLELPQEKQDKLMNFAREILAERNEQLLNNI